MEIPSRHEREVPPKQEKALLLFATGGTQDNFVCMEVPPEYHTIFVWEKPPDFEERIATGPDVETVAYQIAQHVGWRLSDNPPDLAVSYSPGMTAEDLAEKIKQAALNLPEPTAYDISGIIPGVFGFNGEFVAEVAAHYGVVGPSVEAGRLLEDKRRFSKVLKGIGYLTPQEQLCDAPPEERETQILEATERIGAATVVKPNDGVGSIGCENDNPEWPLVERRRRIARHLAETVQYKERFSRPRVSATLVQERIEGDEAGLQVLVNRGEVFPFYTFKDMWGNKERRHSYDEADPFHLWCQTYISPYLPQLMRRLGIREGPYNGDIKIPKEWREMAIRREYPALLPSDMAAPAESPMFNLIDASNRLGGDGLAVLETVVFKRHFGRYALAIALGEDIRSALANLKPQGAAAIEVGFPDGGDVVIAPNPRQFAHAIETSGAIFHANVFAFLKAQHLEPLTSYFRAAGHPVVGAFGKDANEVRQQLDNAFSHLGAALFTDGGIDMYIPDGLIHVRGENGTALSLGQAHDLLRERFIIGSEGNSSQATPFTVSKKEYV